MGHSQWYEDVVEKHVDAAASGLSREAVEAARQRGREGDPWEVVADLLAELEQAET